MKVLKINNLIVVKFDDGTAYQQNVANDELYQQILSLQGDEEAIKSLLFEEFAEKQKEIKAIKDFRENLKHSQYMVLKGDSVYIPSISELSVPQELCTEILKAEMEEDENKLTSYLNFWTLCSLNPDSRARTNLFWFLKKYGFFITSSGLFVAYRNADIKDSNNFNTDLIKVITDTYIKVKFSHKKSPKNYYLIFNRETSEFKAFKPKTEFKSDLAMVHFLEDRNEELITHPYSQDLVTLEELYQLINTLDASPTYTDHHSHTFEIKIGKPVTMPREEVDSVQEHTCSQGLHLASKGWLKSNYYGSVGLKCLVNPQNVCAVPPEDGYGKMRVCEYLPVSVIEYDEEGNIIDEDNEFFNDYIEETYTDSYLKFICYGGDKNEEEDKVFTIAIPETPEVKKEQIYENLTKIQLKLKNRVNYNKPFETVHISEVLQDYEYQYVLDNTIDEEEEDEDYFD